MRGAAVADAQATLQQGSRGLAELHHEFHCVTIHGIFFSVAVAATFAAAAFRSGLAFSLGRFQELLLIFGQTLRLPEFDHRGDFFFRNEWRVQPMDARRT